MEEEKAKAVSGEKVILKRDDFTLVERPATIGHSDCVCFLYGTHVGEFSSVERGAFIKLMCNDGFLLEIHGLAWMEGGSRPKRIICDPDKLEIRAVF